MSNKNKTIHISGMTCTSCEILITNELNGIEEINEVTVHHKKNIAQIKYQDKEPNFNKIIEKIRNLGYNASLTIDGLVIKKEKTTPTQWIYSLLIIFGLYIIYRYLKWIGVLSWINIDSSDISFGVAFLIGIVASLSTCLAVVGAVVMSFGAKYQSRGNFFQANVKPHLLFHIGRLSTFFVLGGLLGAIGSWFELSGSGMGYFTIFVAIILAWLGLNILGILPSLSSTGIHMPKKIMHLWNKVEKSEHALAPIAIGGLTFFLPCGFTQSMQIFAVASGNFMTGAWTLFLFALGTGPVLLGLGIATTRFKNKKNIVFKKAVGFLVVIFALYTLATGFALTGISIDLPAQTNLDNTVETTGDVQIVEMQVDYNGFTPNVIKIKKDIPVKWIINGVQVSGCSNKIIVPDLNISKSIIKGENIVEFTPQDVGSISFSCWMGMIRGKFIVE